MKKPIIFVSILIICLTILIIAHKKYSDPFYHVNKIFDSYSDISKDFNYTMSLDFDVQENYQSDYYFPLKYSNGEVITVTFWKLPQMYNVPRSFFVDLSEIESDESGIIDIVSATCTVLDKSLTVEEAKAFAVKIIEQPDTIIEIGDYSVIYDPMGYTELNLFVKYKEE